MHLTQYSSDIKQIPVKDHQDDSEGPEIQAMRSRKIREFERQQEEIRKAKDFRIRLLEKNKNAAIANEEKILAKKKYTYNYAGEIMFVKSSDGDKLPETLYLPKYGTKIKPLSKISENTIHKIKNENLTADEYIEQHFK